ncbi:hypothetical protein BRW64_00935 [Mycolicibacterium diernhoferi]|uniref:(2Fe-2S)-binding protein n=1 Tax=Mycolicibacterium diernhoferi TaxID=1801 RepID=A0A1Q4HMC6_9MYCO|nr:hypothetical protein BRW64_00935 [Mycolicibacterium diernhoferi]OPE55767.1 hypothetical protein BV510_03345 [Mycolicibacterium diernhoferi]PEG56293.1 (2Fe-2S)-binding protein [Mycolicibacterium diernhoferi]
MPGRPRLPRALRRSAPAPVNPPTADFEVELARSGRVLTVPADRSILDTLEDAGVGPANSCRNGICGSCETAVISGTPIHRDFYLSAEQQSAGTCMTVCVSRAPAGSRLVLDI